MARSWSAGFLGLCAWWAADLVAAQEKELQSLAGHKGDVVVVAVSADGTRIASGSDDKTIKVWDAKTGKELMTLTGHESGVVSLAIAPNATLLASAAHLVVHLRHLATQKVVHQFKVDFS